MIEGLTHTEGACVLIVDDEDGIRDTLREAVEMAGCSAVTASNGAEALELMAKWHPCLVILDLLMPIMSGGQMIEAMRKEPSMAGIAVLVSTSAPAMAPAGLPVLPKPIDIATLWDWMSRACRCVPERSGYPVRFAKNVSR